MDPRAHENPWETLAAIVESRDSGRLASFLEHLGPSEMARAISRLAQQHQHDLLVLLDPSEAAEVIGDVPEAQAADLIENLPADKAAAILDAVPSANQADLLGHLEEGDAEAILEKMAPEEAKDARQLLQYPVDAAGGIMVTEYVAYAQEWRVGDLIADLERRREMYADYTIQYLYVLDESQRLVGVMRMRDLIFSERGARLADVMIRHPLAVNVNDSLDTLRGFFERHHLLAAPVVDAEGRMVGLVRRSALERAAAKRVGRQFLGISGIIGGDEFRTMPLMHRTGRRLSWLSINIVLNLIAASVIAVYQDTLAAAIALAVFLPMISDMSGCSGNQAVAVSMRELTLGLVRPTELLRVLGKEASLGILNGVVLGGLLGVIAFVWKSNPYLGLVVGSALALNTVVAVSLGGLLPLLFKRIRLDPALVSGPVLTTVTDLCGFFFVLSLATLLLPRIAGR